MQFFKFASIGKYLIYYVYGLRYTLKLAVCVIILGILSGIIFGLMRVSRNKILSMFSAAYVNFIRGTPMLVQVYIVYYGLNLNISSFMAGVIALILLKLYEAESRQLIKDKWKQPEALGNLTVRECCW